MNPAIRFALVLFGTGAAHVAQAAFPQSYTQYSYSLQTIGQPGAQVVKNMSNTADGAQDVGDSAMSQGSAAIYSPYGPGPVSTQSGTASVSGRADFARLALRSTANGSKSVGSFVATNGQTFHNDLLALSSASGSVINVDQFTITSASLPIGTPVDVEFAWQLRARFSQDQYSSSFIASVDPIYYEQLLPWARLTVPGGNHQLSYWNNGAGGVLEGSYVRQTTVGAVVGVNAGLTAYAPGVRAYFPLSQVVQGGPTDERTPLAVSASSDASQTAYFAVRVLTEGAGYEAASTTLYPTELPPVPEPASWFLLLLGGAMLAAKSQRNRRTKSTVT